MNYNSKDTESQLSRGKVVTLFLLLGIVVLMIFLRLFVFGMFTVPSESMEKTILAGDNIIGNKLSIKTSPIEQNDIIIFETDTTYIKRVIATAGQTVDIKGGKVFVNGELFENSSTQGETYPLQNNIGITYPYTVPDNAVFVMGDNRENSYDSRCMGSISCDAIIARPACIIYPPDRFMVVPN